MANYSVIWSAVLAAGAGSVSVGSCLVSNGSGGYLIATTANLGTKRASGIARTAGTAGQAVELQTFGPIPATATGLGTGTAGPLKVSSAGVLQRVASVTGSDEVVGYCETDGSAFVFFGMAGVLNELAGGGPGGSGITGLYDVTVDGTATGDGTTDDKAAIEAAITAAVAAGKALWFPPGTYRVAGNLSITSPVHLMGLGGAGINASGDVAALSILEFDQGYGLTLGTGSRGYNIENLAIQQGATHEAGTKDGVTILEKGVFRNVTVRYFGGDGFAIATALGNEVTETMWFNCWVYNCAKGWSIETGNSSIFGGAAYDCREQGVYIANVFGCTVVGTKLRGCNSGGVGFQITGAVGDEDGQGQHLAIGCGVSGGNGTIYVGASAMWIGGASGAGFATTSKGLRLSEQDNCSPINVINNEGTIDVQSTVGVNGTAQIVYQWQSSDDGDEWRMFYDETTNYAKWAVKQMGESTEAYALTHNDHVQGAGIMAFPQGFVLGASGNGRIITSGSAAPSGASRRPTGNWWQGDIVYNNAPTAGGTLCWVCVTDGNPGTWKTVSINA